MGRAQADLNRVGPNRELVGRFNQDKGPPSIGFGSFDAMDWAKPSWKWAEFDRPLTEQNTEHMLAKKEHSGSRIEAYECPLDSVTVAFEGQFFFLDKNQVKVNYP